MSPKLRKLRQHMGGGGGAGSAPAAFSITSAVAGTAQITVTWPAVSGATSYTIKRGTSTGVYGTTLDTGATSPYVDTSSLVDGTTYYYRVYAVNSFGTTTSTNEVSAVAFVDTYSWDFDGVDERIDVGTAMKPQSNQAFSLSIWAYLVDYGAYRALWGSIDNNATARGITWFVSPITHRLAIQIIADASVNKYIDIGASAVTFPLTTWTHTVVTYDGSRTAAGVKMYQQAVSLTLATVKDTLDATTIIPTSTSRLGNDSGGADFWKGKLNNPCFVNRVLTQTEISELYATTHPTNLAAFSGAADRVNWWKPVIATFPTMPDVVGSVNGTMTNMEVGDIVASVP